jgi:pyruvate dehydrogenase E1 component alpha subunit
MRNELTREAAMTKRSTPPPIDQTRMLALYTRMLTIRLTEQKLSELFADGEVPGFIHLSIGQEAIAVGVGDVLSKVDTLASTHRGHGHALAKGVDLELFFLEIMGKAEGLCKGRGGSMHVADLSIGMLGANGIVGAGIPIAVGSALAHQVKKTGGVAAAFFGDGAMAEGVIHESMNLAALWKLPVLFVCENNGWSEFSPTHKQFNAKLVELAGAFGIHAERIDGADVALVADTAKRLVEAARKGAPQVLECMTERHRGHFEGDAQKYRDAGELEKARSTDPVVRAYDALRKLGVSDADLEAVHAQVKAQIERATERARQGSEPCFESALSDVYTGGAHG